ncbi:MAG: hypothetical protein ACUZ8I_11820 [Candidatus Scalindua sp.]
MYSLADPERIIYGKDGIMLREIGTTCGIVKMILKLQFGGQPNWTASEGKQQL